MLIVLLWIAIFINVLESFSPTPSPRKWSSTSLTSTSTVASSPETASASVTLLLPPFIKGEEGYPSPLHKIYVETLLSQEEAATCYKLATDHAKSTGRWETPDSERHQSYATCDFPIDDCETLETYFQDIDFDERLFGRFSELYGIDSDDMEYLDLFCVNYQAKESEDSQVMDRLEAHRDGSLLSFSLLLNKPEQFEGGGTFYDALRDVDPANIPVLHKGGIIRPKRAGDICLHSGKILHGADVITTGTRTVLVGFIDVAERHQHPGALADACTEFGRMDVAAYRFKRQAEKEHKGWIRDNDKWASGTSRITGYAPAFSSVIRRADPEYQRLQKLKAEDMLLRSVLIPENERETDFYGGDITIL
jgi:hypothetical protein